MGTALWSAALSVYVSTFAFAQLPVGQRFEQGKALMEALRTRYADLKDVQFDFDAWIEGRTNGQLTKSTESGTMKFRFLDGSYRMTTRIIGGVHERIQDRAVLGKSVTILSLRTVGGRRQRTYSSGTAHEVGCNGFCGPLMHFVAAARPVDYAVELVGWEHVGGVLGVGGARCAHIAIYDRKFLGRMLTEYIESGEKPPGIFGLHIWLDVDRALALRTGVAVYRGELDPPEAWFAPTEIKNARRVEWDADQPHLWVPAEWVMEETHEYRTQTISKTVSTKLRVVVIGKSIRVNVGFEDDDFRIEPPEDVAGPQTPPVEVAESDGTSVALLPQGSIGAAPQVGPEALDQQPTEADLAAPSKTQQRAWIIVATAAVGTLLLSLGLYLRRTRA